MLLCGTEPQHGNTEREREKKKGVPPTAAQQEEKNVLKNERGTNKSHFNKRSQVAKLFLSW